MVRPQRSTTGSTAGRAGASGSSCWMRWSRPGRSRRAPRSTAPTSRRSARRSGEKGRSHQAIGRSRGGWTTKVHALTDIIGRPYALMLTAGNVSDIKAAPALLERAGRMRYLLADKGYDADRLRRSLREAGAVPIIPGRPAQSQAHHPLRQGSLPNPAPYRERLLSPQGLPPHRHPLRKLAGNFHSGVALATAVAFWL
jgi:Transposase DDE domain